METIRGRVSREMDYGEFRARLSGYGGVLLDLGTGDGRYVHTLARQQPDRFVIGVDACRENLREYSRTEQRNALFVIAEAQHLPQELGGLATCIMINFPWGSLLDGLLNPDSALMGAIAGAIAPAASLEVRLNAGALAEAGHTLDNGAQQVRSSLSRCGWLVDAPQTINGAALRAFPSTWSKRLAFGRDPRAVMLTARRA